jgi:hypothetical protein
VGQLVDMQVQHYSIGGRRRDGAHEGHCPTRHLLGDLRDGRAMPHAHPIRRALPGLVVDDQAPARAPDPAPALLAHRQHAEGRRRAAGSRHLTHPHIQRHRPSFRDSGLDLKE